MNAITFLMKMIITLFGLVLIQVPLRVMIMDPIEPRFSGENGLFLAMAMTLRPRDRQVMTIADSSYAHAAILDIITKEDPALGHILHEMKRHKRIAIAIFEGLGRATLLRVSFMGQEGLAGAHLLMGVLTQGRTLRLGKALCDVYDITIDRSRWSGVSTWADITAQTAGRRLHFDFVTPTAIAKCDDCGERFFSLFPDPYDLFSGLAQRWKGLEGPALPDDLTSFVEGGGCVTANYKLQTVEFRTRERTQIGFVGSVVYECHKVSPSHVNALCALTRLAFFTGVGYQTARGMGLVRTWITR